jgi:hypothetical protein
MLPTLPAWAVQLIAHGEDAPLRLLDAIRSEREAARAALCGLVRGVYSVDGEFPDGGWARVHAARLLGDLPPDEDALATCLEQLELADVDHLTEAVVATMKRWGPLVVPHVLPYVAGADRDVAKYAADILAHCGAREDRVLAALVAAIATDPLFAVHLADYGDPAALPAVQRALDAYELVEERTVMCDQVVFELADAISALGGEPTSAQKEKVERVHRRRRRALRDLGIDPDAPAGDEPGLESLFRAGLRPRAAGRPALFVSK